MGYEIILIGENLNKEEFYNYSEEDVVLENNIAIISFKNQVISNSFYREYKNKGKYDVFTLEEFESGLKETETNYKDLEKCTFKECIEWQFKGLENFIVVNDGILSTWEINYDTVNKITDTLLKGQSVVSTNGTFLVNYYKHKLVIRVVNFDKIFGEFEFINEILKCEFNQCDSHLIVYTTTNCIIIDIVLGRIVKEFDCGDCVFDCTGENVIIKDQQEQYSIKNSTITPYEKGYTINNLKTKHGQTLIYCTGKTQKIIYCCQKGTQTKTQANVLEVNFFFSKHRAYALLTKDIGGKKKYSIETYSQDLLTINNIETEIKKIQVSDNSFITYDCNKIVTFYKLDKFNFIKVKEISKDDDVVISVYGTMFCVYDGETENIELYDGSELRSVYSHQACTNILWSESGLYCASVSRSTGLTQLYNNNGKMFWKKIFNRVSGFIWRPYFSLSEEKKDLSIYNLDEYKRPFDVSSAAGSNINELISEWKKFLTDKRQFINQI